MPAEAETVAEEATQEQKIIESKLSDREDKAINSMADKFHQLMGGLSASPATSATPQAKVAPVDEPPTKPKEEAKPAEKPKAKLDPRKLPTPDAPKPVAPTAEAGPLDNVEAPAEIKSDKGKADWAHYKQIVAQREADLKKRIAELEAAPKPAVTATNGEADERFKKLQEERDAYRRQLQAAELLTSDEFAGYYEKAFDKEVRIAQQIVGAEKSKDVIELLKQPDSEARTAKIVGLVEELGAAKGQRLVNVVDQIERLNFEKAEALNAIEANYAKLRKMQQEKADKERAENEAQRKTIVDKTIEVAKRLPSFQAEEGNSEHNDAIPQREEFVRLVLNGQVQDDQQIALLPVWAAHGLWQEQTLVPKLKAEIATLKEQVQALSGATPRGSSTAQTPPKTDKRKLTFEQRYQQALAGEE